LEQEIKRSGGVGLPKIPPELLALLFTHWRSYQLPGPSKWQSSGNEQLSGAIRELAASSAYRRARRSGDLF
jgi:hypothetical protein